MFQKVKRVIMRNLCDTIFYINTSVLQNFHICMSVPLICVFKIFLINEMTFLMIFNSINPEILKISENEIVQVLLFGNNSFSKDMNFRIITSSIRLINPLSADITQWSNTLIQFVVKVPMNCLSVFDHFVIVALKGLKTVKDLMNYPLLERNLFDIFSLE